MRMHHVAGQQRRPMSFIALGVACWVLFWDEATAGFAPLSTPPPATLEWGAATSAYQVEGAVNAGGRGRSIYESWLKQPFTTQDNSNADVTADFYHKYPEDIAIMKTLGLPNFRMSISWPRIYPQGSGEINLDGLAFYDKVIDGLLAAKVKPYVTLYHWDLPEALQKAYGGFLNTTQFVVDFVNYATTVAEHFGDRVQSYVTFNEPSSLCAFGYGLGVSAPGVIGNYYRCVYTLLSAHAAAAKKIRVINPTVKIGLAMFQDWPQPLTDSPDDIEAAERYYDFQAGIYAEPTFKGDYPASVKRRVPSYILPRISPQLKKDLLASTDFYGMNHYTAIWVWYQPFAPGLYSQGITDYLAGFTAPNGTIIGSTTGSTWAFWTPWSFRKMLNFVNDRFHPKEIHTTEQGFIVENEWQLTIPQAQRDIQRIAFFQAYLQGANEAIREDGVPLTKYFVWAFMDNWEWYGGYHPRFGIVYTDYANNQTRYVKDSAKWLANYFGTLPNRTSFAPTYRQEERAGWRYPYVGA